MPSPVLEERVAEAEPEAELVVVVVGEVAGRAEQIEAGGQGAVEEPGLGEAHDALLGVGPQSQADRGFPPAPQEVALGEVDGAEEAVRRGEATTEREDPGGPLLDFHVDDDLRLVGAGRGADVDHFEEPEIVQPLLGPLHLLEGEQLALVHGDLAAEDLVLGAHVAGDVDALHIRFGAFVDVEHEADLGRRLHLFGPGTHVGRGVSDGAVEIGDLAQRVPQLGAGEDVPDLELDHATDLDLREQGHARDGEALQSVLRALHDREDQGYSRPLAVQLDLVAIDARLDVAVVVVEGEDALDVLVETLALELPGQDPVLPLLGAQDLLDLALGESLGAPDDDLVDGDPAPLVDAEDDFHVPVGELLHFRGDLDLEIALGLVVILEHFLGLLHHHRVVHAAELEVDLLLEIAGRELLVSGEVDVADERALDEHERHLHPAFEVLHLELDVVEESQGKDGAHVLRELRGIEEAARLRLDAPEDHRLLDAAISFDGDVADGDGARRLKLGESRHRHQQGRARTKNGETHAPPSAHRAVRLGRSVPNALQARGGRPRAGPLETRSCPRQCPPRCARSPKSGRARSPPPTDLRCASGSSAVAGGHRRSGRSPSPPKPARRLR